MTKSTPKRRLFADRAARWLVSAGGIAIIASILGILIFILVEVLPLIYPAKVEPVRRVAVAGPGRSARCWWTSTAPMWRPWTTRTGAGGPPG